MSISFRANPVATTVLQTQSQQNNALGLSENGQKVLNKTNVHANAYDLASTVVDSDKRKENLATVAKNTLMMPVMSSTNVSTVYTYTSTDLYRTRAFSSPKNYYFPIPDAEIKRLPNLGQNTGWELTAGNGSGGEESTPVE